MTTVGSLAWSLISDASRFIAGTSSSRKAARQLRSDLVGVGSAASNLGGVMDALGVRLSGAAILGGMQSLVSSSFESIDAMAKLSDRLEVATERLTGLRHAASLAGVGGEQFDSMFEKMTKTIGDLSLKGGEGAELLGRFGLDVEKLASAAPDEAFLQIADAVSRIQDPMQRASVATAVFGKQGMELLNTLMQGREAIEDQIVEAEQLGIAYSRVDAARIEEANDAWDRMKAAIGGVANTIAIDLAPQVEKLARDITTFVTGMEDATTPARTPEQQKEIDDAAWDSFIGSFFLAAEVDAENRRQAALERRLHAENIEGPAGLTPTDAPDPATERAQKSAEKAAERAAADLRERHADRILKRMERESDLMDDLADRANKIFDAVQTPAERLGSEFKELAAMRSHLADSTFSAGLADIKSRALEIAERGKALPSTAQAVRVGSVEALRAQVSGSRPVGERQLDAQKKQLEEQEEANALLADIRDEMRVTRLLEAPD